MRFLALVLAAFLAVGVYPARPETTARYRMTFHATWSAAEFPQDFPWFAHFSGPIGATHDGRYSVFAEGGTATEGLKRVAERGKDSPLDQEIGAAIKAGTAAALIVGDTLSQLPGQTSVEFTIDERHPLVSIVAMIAPSPDWFTGVAGVNLLENGQWLPEKSVAVYAWDAGTDSGTTYRAADAVTEPRGRVALSDAPYFSKDGQPRSVGTVTFKRLK